VARFDLRIKPSAAKEIDALPRKSDRRRVVHRIEALADDPRPPGAGKLSGRDRYRLRVGRYRIVYAIEDDELVVVEVRVGQRKDVYRNLP
jgi:mRNA interferase RelE/StbE